MGNEPSNDGFKTTMKPNKGKDFRHKAKSRWFEKPEYKQENHNVKGCPWCIANRLHKIERQKPLEERD